MDLPPDREFIDHDGFGRSIHGARRDSADGLDDIDALDHAPENRMTVIQVRCRAQCDEKLAAVGVRTGVGHRKDAFRVMAQAGVEFVFKAVAGATCSGALRAPALNHKACNYPVKGKAVVKRPLLFGGLAAFRQIDEIPDGFRAFSTVSW